jgi:putative colanic acid biosynthesis glycosyltransferase WcaI
MKILIYGINFWPELTGVGKYTGEMAEWLASRSHDVHVITAPPYYPQWRIASGYSAWCYRHEARKTISVWRCPLWIPKRLTLLQRLLHLLSFSMTSLPVVLWQGLLTRPDLIIAVQPPLFCAPIAWLTAKLSRAKSWLHIQDNELKAAFELGFLRGRHLQRALESTESSLLRCFDHVSSISPTMVGQLAARGVPDQKRYLFPNWVDTEAICPLDTDNPFREQLGFSKEDIVAVYAGNMGRKQGLEILLEASRLLRDNPSIHLVLSGDGSMRSKLMKQASGLANVHFLPLQPPEQFNALLNLADIHLLIQEPRAFDAFMPSKLTGMLASGRPVIATFPEDSEVAGTLKGCGVLVAPGNSRALAEAIVAVAENPALRSQMGRVARDRAVALWEKQRVLSTFEAAVMKPLRHREPNQNIYA